MKIIYLKAGNTTELSGGGAEASKMLHAIEQWVENNPESSLSVVSGDRMDIQGREAPIKRHWKDVASRILLHSSYLYIDWCFKGLKDSIIGANPDMIFLGNSRLGFAIDEIRRMIPDCFLIVHFDNVEFDYVESAFSMKRGILGRLLKNIEKITVKRDEAIGSLDSNIRLFLTERDKDRIEMLYGIGEGMSVVLPICLPDNQVKLHKLSEVSPHLVFLGSLWYESNVMALLWFLDNIWMAVKASFPNATLTVGGRNPSKHLIDYLTKERGVILFPDFENIADVVCRNSIFISPIQKGAGMKVKIAEALSLGLPILASEESLVGYSEALLDSMNRGVIIKAETKEEYIDGLKSVIESDLKEVSDNARRLFVKYYSYERAITSMNDILGKINQKKGNNNG